MEKKKILLLGSTGSVGKQTLEVVRQFPDVIQVQGISAHKNIRLLEEQILEFKPSFFCVTGDLSEKEQKKLITKYPYIKSYFKPEGLLSMIRDSDAKTVVISIVGQAGIPPTQVSLQTRKHVALATKEVLVVAGEEMMKLAKENNVHIIPVDSEHSALWQCFRSGKKEEIKKLWITCSGGPFRDKEKWPLEKFKEISITDALNHPNWDMGNKISIDSATLMNKALEVIEAVRLFQIPYENIEVVIHPQSYLHSAVEYCDGSIIGQIGTPDMKLPIAYALFYPERPSLSFPKFSFFGKTFHFEEVDHKRFPSLRYAKKALQQNKCQEFNTANEQAVSRFLKKEISFLDIFSSVKASLE